MTGRAPYPIRNPLPALPRPLRDTPQLFDAPPTRASYVQTMRVYCLYCGAPPGERCTNAQGQTMWKVHKRRRDRAARNSRAA